ALVDVEGQVVDGFEPVVDAFASNFVALGEIGAAVAVYHGGRLVVDLAGGWDPVLERQFTRDSLVRVASCSKGATATCVLILGEVVRRVIGQTLGAWFAANVVAPLGLEFWIGLPAELDERVVAFVEPPRPDAQAELAQGPEAGSFAARRLAALAERPPREPD